MMLPRILKPKKASKVFSILFTTLIVFSTVSPLLALSSKAEAASYTPADSSFVTTNTYIRENNHGDVASQIIVPDAASEIRYTITGDGYNNTITDADTTDNTYSEDIYKTNGAAAGYQWWRLQTDLTNGQYSLTAEFNVSGTWYPVTGSETLFVLDIPWFTYVTPASTGMYYRAGDQFARVNIDDQYNQFLSVTFAIFDSNTNTQVGPNYIVNRADCSVGSLGNYLTCDLMRDFTGTKPSLSDGTYYVKIQSDTIPHTGVRFSHANSQSNVFTIDSTRPTTSNLTIDTVQNPLSVTTTASVNAADNNGIKNVRFYITAPRVSDGMCDGNGTILASNTVTTVDPDGKYRTTFDTTPFDGYYCVNAIAEDLAISHSNPIERTKILIDNTAPAITVNNIVTNDNTPGVTGTVNDPAATITLLIDGNSYNAANNGDGTWTLGDNIVLALSEGFYNVAATATDTANNAGHDTTSNELTIDLSNPVIDAGTNIAVNSLTNLHGTVDANISGLKDVQWSVVSGTGNITFGDATSLTTTVSADADGQYVIGLTVTDNAGNTSYDELTLTWDTAAPTLTEVTQIGTFIDSFGERYTADNTPDYIFNSTEAGSLSTQGACSTGTTDVTTGDNTITFNLLTDGPKSDCVLVVTDNSGNMGTLSITPFAVDATAPVITWDSPLNNAHIKGSVSLSATASDDLSGVKTQRFSYQIVDSGSWTTLPEGTTILDTTGLANGDYELRVESEDNVGNTAEAYIYVTVDNQAPTLTFINNVEAGPVQDDYVSMQAVDDNLDLSSLNYAITTEACDENIVFTETYTNSSSVFLNTDDNNKYVCIKAADKAGNVAYLQSAYTINIDQEQPLIDTIENQIFNEGQLVNLGILNGKGVSDDTGLDRIYLSINYMDRHENTKNYSTSFDVSESGGDGLGGTLNDLYMEWMDEVIDFDAENMPVDTSIFDEGLYTFDYYVTDLAGNQSDCDVETEGDQHCSFTVIINNVAPTVSLNQSQTVQEGETVNFTGSFEDPSFILNIGNYNLLSIIRDEILGEVSYVPDDAAWEIDMDYGNDVHSTGTIATPSNITIPAGVYTQSGTYTATLTICEANTEGSKGEGECASDSVVITVLNSEPNVAITANPADTTIAQAISMTANITGLNAPFTIIGWSDGNFVGCTGNANTVTTPNISGTYFCKVTVQDNDGDTVTATKTVTVNAQPTNREVPPNRSQGRVLGTSTSDNDTSDSDSEATSDTDTDTDTSTDGEVLGENTCDNASKVSGYVYVDENSNSKKDKDEKGLKEITIKLYSKGSDKKLISRVETNSDGYWETEACPGDYEVEIVKDDISNEYKLDDKEVKGLTVSAGEDTKDVNFKLADEGTSYLWLMCLIPLLALLLGGIVYYLVQRRDDKLKLDD